jgi:hypothetical protein
MRRRAFNTQILPQTPHGKRSALPPAGAATHFTAAPTSRAAPCARNAPPRRTTEVGEPQPHSHGGTLQRRPPFDVLGALGHIIAHAAFEGLGRPRGDGRGQLRPTKLRRKTGDGRKEWRAGAGHSPHRLDRGARLCTPPAARAQVGGLLAGPELAQRPAEGPWAAPRTRRRHQGQAQFAAPRDPAERWAARRWQTTPGVSCQYTLAPRDADRGTGRRGSISRSSC